MGVPQSLDALMENHRTTNGLWTRVLLWLRAYLYALLMFNPRPGNKWSIIAGSGLGHPVLWKSLEKSWRHGAMAPCSRDFRFKISAHTEYREYIRISEEYIMIPQYTWCRRASSCLICLPIQVKQHFYRVWKARTGNVSWRASFPKNLSRLKSHKQCQENPTCELHQLHHWGRWITHS